MKIDEFSRLLASDSDAEAVDTFVVTVQRISKGLDSKKQSRPNNRKLEKALAQIYSAMKEFLVSNDHVLWSSGALLKDLRRLASKPNRAVLKRALGRFDLRSHLLTLLWQGALAAGTMRRASADRWEIRTQGEWKPVICTDDAWAWVSIAALARGLSHLEDEIEQYNDDQGNP